MELAYISDERLREILHACLDELQRRRYQQHEVELASRHNRAAEIERMLDVNSTELRSIPPKVWKAPLQERSRYLHCLLAQDWGSRFPVGGGPQEYYVYAHLDLTKRFYLDQDFDGPHSKLRFVPFYIGKGKGDRAWQTKRCEGHGIELRTHLKANKMEKLVHILADNLTEQQALILEEKLIYFFGTRNHVDKRGNLTNLDMPLPAFVGQMAAFPRKKAGRVNIAEELFNRPYSQFANQKDRRAIRQEPPSAQKILKKKQKAIKHREWLGSGLTT